MLLRVEKKHILTSLLDLTLCAQDGVMSSEDVDKVFTAGLGMRYAFCGPFEVIHLNAEGKDKVQNQNIIRLVNFYLGYTISSRPK